MSHPADVLARVLHDVLDVLSGRKASLSPAEAQAHHDALDSLRALAETAPVVPVPDAVPAPTPAPQTSPGEL